MPKPLRAVLGIFLLAATIGLVTCQSIFYSDNNAHSGTISLTD